MSTPIMQVLCEYCNVYVDDIRLSELKDTDLPLYATKMFGYFLPAISLFSIPPEIQEYLLGTPDEPNLIQPIYATAQHAIETEQTSAFEVSLGDAYKGFELCGCRILILDSNGYVSSATAIKVAYDGVTGTATIPASASNPVSAGAILDFDFYTDGYFKNTLDRAMMNILGKCFQIIWQDRFNSDWLSNVSKTEDKSFYEQNRANKMNADTQRLNSLRQQLADEMRRYAQNLEYKKIVLGKS